MIFSKKITGNSRSAVTQWAEVVRAREAMNLQEAMFANTGQMQGNAGLIPRDVYQEFDNVTVELMHSDDGDTFLNDLLPLSRSISIGKLVQQFRRASDAGVIQTSMTGQIGVKMDQVEYSYDGAIVPIHDGGFDRNWREWAAQTSEGFDALIDDQREVVRSARIHLADQFMDGHTDTQGNNIVVDGISWGGMRNDSRVAAIDLGAGGINFDFTDTTKTFLLIEAAFKAIRNVMWITNNVEQDLTIYVSREVASNFERNSSESYSSQKILERLATLQGIASIKATSKLVGNQLMGFPLNGNVRPIVGMGMNTVAMPRPVYNSNYEFVTWSAIGFEVRVDYSGQTSAFYASA